MVAVGSLGEVWTDFFALDEQDLKGEFSRFFGAPWDELMVGAIKPFSMHQYWDGYFAVRDMKPVAGMTLADLAGPVEGVPRFNILIG